MDGTVSRRNVDDDFVWKSRSRWYRRNYTSEQAAQLLDDSGQELVGEFFAAHRGTDLWTLAEIYNHIAARHPQDARIPRLFPLTDRREPTRLLYTQAVEIPSHYAQYVVHAWDPRDHRGLIAIAYPVRDNERTPPDEAADTLLGLLPWASAVAVPSGHDEPTMFTANGIQPGIWVSDGRITRTHDQVGISTEHYGWADLANLLRTDLPWWPKGLRERDAMLVWRPGDDSKKIDPGIERLNPEAFWRVLPPHGSPTLKSVVARAAASIEHEACALLDDRGTDDYEPFPGLLKAARSSRITDPRQQPDNLSPGEIALLMHHPVADHRAAARVAEMLGPNEVISGLHRVESGTKAHRLAQPWLDRLVAAPNPDEIGFRYLDHLLTGPEPAEYLVHPSWPDCWIIRQGTTTHLTVGTSVPATGHLREVHVREKYAFFRDSTGAVWPLPCPMPSADPLTDLALLMLLLCGDAGFTAMSSDPLDTEPLHSIVEQLKAGPMIFINPQ